MNMRALHGPSWFLCAGYAFQEHIACPVSKMPRISPTRAVANVGSHVGQFTAHVHSSHSRMVGCLAAIGMEHLIGLSIHHTLVVTDQELPAAPLPQRALLL